MHTLLTEEEWRSGERGRAGAGRGHFADGKSEGRREVIAELRAWVLSRLDHIVGVESQVAVGERYGMNRVVRKLDELEAEE